MQTKASRWRAGAALLAAAVVLGACSAGAGSPPAATGAGRHHDHTASSTTTTASTTTTTTTPSPPVVWSSCGSDLQCGTLTVPLDYANPDGPTIGIALERHLALIPSQRIGSLVINPGGPGVSGIDDFANELSVLTSGLLDQFDIVTFDPRGVQRSDPVTCGETPGPPSGTLPDPVPQSAAAQQSYITSLRQFGQDCAKASGTVLPFVGTVEVAQDLDRLRIALGDPALSYMGQSYGTLLGLTYAQLFPSHVRAMVLDSVIDPSLTLSQMTLGQAKGFEQEVQNFFNWCRGSSSCPWRTGSDPTSTLLAQIAAARAHAAPAGAGRSAGPGELYDALLDGLYSTTSWPRLASALAEDDAGNGSAVVTMSDAYNANGSTNGSDAGEAVDCMDHPAPTGLKAYNALQFEFSVSSPIFGPLLSWGEAACWQWPAAPTRQPAVVTAPGSPPVLVVGTTGDPATPYAWAQSVAAHLAHGVLLTRNGSDHVSYFYSSCVRSYVQNYLLGVSSPPNGTVCPS